MASGSYPYSSHRTRRDSENNDEVERPTSSHGLLISGIDQAQHGESSSQYQLGGVQPTGAASRLVEPSTTEAFPTSPVITISEPLEYYAERSTQQQEPTEITSPFSPQSAHPSFGSSYPREIDVDSLLDVAGSTGLTREPSARGSVKSDVGSMTGASLGSRGKTKSILSEKISPLLGISRSPRLQPGEIIQQRAEYTAKWGIHYYMPTAMVTIFFLGVLAALGHHCFYNYLNGKRSWNQLTMVRYGNAFAFFVKASLVGSVVVAYRQRIWYTMRRKGMSLRAIDAMFGVIEDPIFFTSFEMMQKAKMAWLLAALTWLIPIASVVSPSALTSELRTISDEKATCQNISTLDFQKEATYSFKTPGLGKSLAFYNETNVGNGMYFDQLTFDAKSIAMQAILGHKPVPPNKSPCSGYTCIYELEFPGPAYKCVDAMKDPVLRSRAPFNTSKVAPEGQYVYFADVMTGDYARPNTRPRDWDFDPRWTIGTFFFEPELWIGHSRTLFKKLPEDHPYRLQNRWNYSVEPLITNCRLYHAQYKLNVTWENKIQTITVLNVTHNEPVMKTFSEDKHPDPDLFMRPGNVNYQLTAVYHALGSIMREYLKGDVFFNASNTIPITHTQMEITMLKEPRRVFPPFDFRERVERFFQDIVFSFWSDPDFEVSVYTNISCKHYTEANLFIYYPRGLWIGYSLAVAATLFSCIVGAFALYDNGISSDILFSRIMATTRNPTIDRLCKGACLGSDPFPKELELTKFRFGVLDEGDGQGSSPGFGPRPGHCAFGTVEETEPIVKGGLYAGLRSREQESNELLGSCTCTCGERNKQKLLSGGTRDDQEDANCDLECDEFYDCEENLNLLACGVL